MTQGLVPAPKRLGAGVQDKASWSDEGALASADLEIGKNVWSCQQISHIRVCTSPSRASTG